MINKIRKILEKDEEKIEKEFNRLVEELTDREFWEYVGSWYDGLMIIDVMKSWDMETKVNEIENMKEVIKNR